MSVKIADVVGILKDIQEEEGIPKKVKEKINDIINSLEENEETSLKVNKCLDELDNLAEDINIPTFIRTQIWNASSVLEKVTN